MLNQRRIVATWVNRPLSRKVKSALPPSSFFERRRRFFCQLCGIPAVMSSNPAAGWFENETDDLPSAFRAFAILEKHFPEAEADYGQGKKLCTKWSYVCWEIGRSIRLRLKPENGGRLRRVLAELADFCGSAGPWSRLLFELCKDGELPILVRKAAPADLRHPVGREGTGRVAQPGALQRRTGQAHGSGQLVKDRARPSVKESGWRLTTPAPGRVALPVVPAPAYICG